MTDVQTGKQQFLQRAVLQGSDVYVTADTVNFRSITRLKQEAGRIYSASDEQVGLCIVELLPGVRNPQSKVKPLGVLRRR